MRGLDTLRWLRRSKAGPILNLPRRASKGFPLATAPLRHYLVWLFSSREDTNVTYRLDEKNLRYLAHTIAVVTGLKVDRVLEYINEARSDTALRDHVIELTRNGPYRSHSDQRADFARRLGWYALVRLLQPNVVVETGVDKGLGAVLLAAAILKNGKGRYYGTDIDPGAGWLLRGKYAEAGKILYGDSLASLAALGDPIDLFINDSDHSAVYEGEEYKLVGPKLAENAMVIGDNADFTDELVKWSEANGRKFLYWKEEPVRHWFPGGGIGFSYK